MAAEGRPPAHLCGAPPGGSALNLSVYGGRIATNPVTLSTAPWELRALVRGYVQGVGFRVFARRQAQALGLAGYVRNTEDGDVEVVAQGPRADLEALLVELQRGPSESEVSSVDHSWDRPKAYYRGFEIAFGIPAAPTYPSRS